MRVSGLRSPGARLRLRLCRMRADHEQRFAVTVDATEHDLSGQRDPGAQYLLWIDGIGGYLVCLSHRVTLGQASLDPVVDIALLADISRHHATIQRDAEGYFLEAVRRSAVNGQPSECS